MAKLELIQKRITPRAHFVWSLLLHTLFIVFVAILHLVNPKDVFILTRPEEIVYVEDRRERPEIEKERQIVESEDAKNREKPKKAFLGERTQKVEKETKASRVGSFRKATDPHSAPSDLSQLALKQNLQPLGHLRPEERINSESGSATNDYLNNVSLGAQTLLNTREYVYFNFYQRVRRQLEQYWEPGLRKKLYKMVSKGRSIASDLELATKLVVTLDRTGSITRVQVKDTSGILDLDDAAVEAFNKAGPFPNPPQGIVGVDGKINIEWEFILRT